MAAWTQITLEEDLELRAEERFLLDFHSFLNVVNVLTGELDLLGLEVPTVNDEVEALGDRLTAWCERLRDPDEGPAAIDELGSISAAVEHFLMTTLARADAASDTVTAKSANIRSILAVMRVRAEEYKQRADKARTWVEVPAATLRRNIETFFRAVERNAKGRYRIAFTPAQRQDGDYLITLDVRGAGSNRLYLPLVVQDILRDLMANARKFTPPGGEIHARLHDNGKGLELVVRDTGEGIPADELHRVVEFGYRASNTRHRKTMGGGFGLTKAYVITRQLGGRMKLASAVGEGTEIRLEIPRAKAASVTRADYLSAPFSRARAVG